MNTLVHLNLNSIDAKWKVYLTLKQIDFWKEVKLLTKVFVVLLYSYVRSHDFDNY